MIGTDRTKQKDKSSKSTTPKQIKAGTAQFRQIEAAVGKAISEYGETLKKLAKSD